MLRNLVVKNQSEVNEHAIAALADKMHCDYKTVKHVYDEEFYKLEAKAQIRDYLVVLASRRTMDMLRHHN